MGKKSKISQLQEQITDLQSQVVTNKQKEVEWATEKTKIEGEKEELETRIEELEEENESKDNQLNEKELKKLARAYADQEKDFSDEAKKWFLFVIGASLSLLVSVVISTILANGEVWYDKFEYYMFDFVFVTFLIFSLKQYSSSNNLRIDFANRKTIAQSYHNIIATVGDEDEEIKLDYLKKATEVLCAPSKVESDSYTIPEKILETLSDTVKFLSKKA